MSEESIKVIKTDINSSNGQEKCPKCGATDISLNINNGKLRCNFCRYEFEPQKIENINTDLRHLKGQVMGSGATDIATDTNDIVTLKCSSCGSEVVIDTSSATSARCHWCRNTLSINQQIPNGSIPDVVLPFSIGKDIAKTEIEKFVEKRKFYAHPKFKKEFTTNNIMGVYFPYMLVDLNAHSNMLGEGEHQTRCYTRGRDNNSMTYYDANLYHVEREFDITIKGLSIESSKDKLDTTSNSKTTNIINSIMPFDTENCVKFNSNYLRGYTSEKRDTNVENLKELVYVQAKDISRFAANDTIKDYDRGVKWYREDFNIKGEQWFSAYLPVWLYSYQEIKGNKKLLHYVAVNARTKETMGSVPIHIPKLILISFLVEVLGILAMLFVDWDYRYLFLLLGFIYYLIIYSKYRNKTARHTYEKDTRKSISNLRKVDEFLKSEKGLSSPRMAGANNTHINGIGNNILNSNEVINILKNINK